MCIRDRFNINYPDTLLQVHVTNPYFYEEEDPDDTMMAIKRLYFALVYAEIVLFAFSRSRFGRYMQALQTIMYMKNYEIRHPTNLKAFLDYGAMDNVYFFIPNALRIFEVFSPEDFESQKAPRPFQRMDVHTIFLVNIGKIIFLAGVLLTVHTVSWFLCRGGKKYENDNRRTRMQLIYGISKLVLRVMTWSLWIDFVNNYCTSIFIYAFLQLMSYEYQRVSLLVSSLLSISCILVYAGYFWHLASYLNKNEVTPGQQTKYEAFFKDHVRKNWTTKAFCLIEMWYGCFFAAIYVFLASHSLYQGTLLVVLDFVWVWLVIINKPFRDKRFQISEAVSAISVLVARGIFTFYAFDEEFNWATGIQRVKIAWGLIGLMLFHPVMHFIIHGKEFTVLCRKGAAIIKVLCSHTRRGRVQPVAVASEWVGPITDLSNQSIIPGKQVL
eukprot:TRINITY_DN716_c0_g1_i24.p1 TRINITY_DN716_c0_g1~~TRINITY_DN716_c0_g1_i24.p1  ORF type:complete len:463 (+),score=33.30 TRINITY_DN716_c0_g1_i24:72-1391(+)